jgi:hypothetical protein
MGLTVSPEKRQIKNLMQPLIQEESWTAILNRSLDKRSSLFHVSTTIHSPKVLEALAVPVVQAVVNAMEADKPLPSRLPAFTVMCDCGCLGSRRWSQWSSLKRRPRVRHKFRKQSCTASWTDGSSRISF